MAQLAASAIVCLAAAHAIAQPSFRIIGVVPGLRNAHSYEVSSDGSVVAGTGNGIDPINLVAWWANPNQTFIVPPLPGSVQSGLDGLSADGRFAAGTCVPLNGGPWIGYRVELGGAPQALAPLPWHEHSQAHGIDSSGAVVCGASYNHGPSGTSAPVLWQNGAAANLGVPIPWTDGGARDVADGGAVVVGSLRDAIANVSGGFRWTTQGGFHILRGPLGTESCHGDRVSPDGRVTTGSCRAGAGGSYHAARWYDNGPGEDLGLLPGYPQSDAFGHSADGRFVLGACWSPTGGRAFLYSDSIGMVDLNAFLIARGLDLQGRTLSQCADITPDGNTLVGTAQSGAPTEAWIAHVPGLGCHADCDLSGSLNIRDFTCFINLFGRGSRDADCNHDGTLNAADFSCFINRFAAGCS